MLGAIVGDIVGSRFEWDNIHTKRFRLFTGDCHFTDDSLMTVAIADAILRSGDGFEDLGRHAVERMRYWGRKYPNSGFGGMFIKWLKSDNPQPYNSFGNGAAMRVSPCGWAGKKLAEVTGLSRLVTEVTHNHPDGLKGAETTAMACFLARKGAPMIEIQDYLQEHYYPMDKELEEIAKDYEWHSDCEGTVVPALECVFEADSFEDAIRNAISLGGDSDTIAAVAGGFAGGYFGVPKKIREAALTYLDEEMQRVVAQFEEKYGAC